MTVVDNPLSWIIGFRGAKNRFDDIEGGSCDVQNLERNNGTDLCLIGPFFIQGAPGVQVDDGQAVLSSTEFLNSGLRYHVFFKLHD